MSKLSFSLDELLVHKSVALCLGRFCDFKTREREQLVAHYNLSHLDTICRELSQQQQNQRSDELERRRASEEAERQERLRHQQQQHQSQQEQHPGEEEVVSFLRMKYLRNQQRWELI